jgi:hypothetical protein
LFDIISSASTGGADSRAPLLVNFSVLEVVRVKEKTYATRIEARIMRPPARSLKYPTLRDAANARNMRLLLLALLIPHSPGISKLDRETASLSHF